MRNCLSRAQHRPRSLGHLGTAALAVLAVLVPAIVGGAGRADAAPAAGYMATLIPTTGDYAYAVAVDSATDTTYVADWVTNEVTVIGSTNTVTATIPLPAQPRGVAVDAATDTIYVSVSQTATSPPGIAVIDGASNTIATTIPLPFGSTPVGVGVNSSTRTVYVAEETASAVAVIDPSTKSVTQVSTGSSSNPRPYALAVDEASDVVWVGQLNSSVVAISGGSNSVTQTISLGGPLVESVAVNPLTDTVYAATVTDGVAVIDGAAGTVSTHISVTANLFAVAVDPGTGTVFASSYLGDTTSSGTTWVIDAASNTVVDTIERGGTGIAVNTATGSAYAAPYTAQPNAVWKLTPSSANAWSPVIKSAGATFTAGTYGSFAVIGSAVPAATYSETGPLPSGVTLSPSGTLSGTPAAGTGGAHPITVTATNGVAPDYSQAFTLTVDEAPTLTAPSTATFQVGTPVSVPIQVSGYPSPGVEASNLPPGVVLTEPALGTWQLSGTPAPGTAGVYQAQLSAANIAGSTPAVPMTITVLQAPAFTSAQATTFFTGTSNSYLVSANCDPACTFSATGSLPSGVHVDSAGLLSGDPPVGTSGTYQFTITATNSVGTANQAFTLTVAQPIALGAEGSDGQLWVQAPQLGLGWHPLGGKIVAPPAVAAPPNPNGSGPVSPLFIATGTNGHLYIRSLTTSWQLLGPVTASCLGGPAAVVTGTSPAGPFRLTVACRGTDNALWENAATVPASGLPQFSSQWTRLGGVLSAGPAAAPVGGTMTFFVRGTNGQIYTRTLTAGYKASPWFCVGQPAAAAVAATGQTIFGCQGRDHAFWQATTSGTGWNAATSLGGSLVGGPAVAATSQTTYLLAEGSNFAVWERTVAVNWFTLGSKVIGGVGAVALN